ncbi:MAG: hypothetical protein IPM63_14025 [Acidobacteriota bacterium]|nr:MAG: hypothetical protein IPM63_14025 [Acidobacteriota bacterium]
MKSLATIVQPSMLVVLVFLAGASAAGQELSRDRVLQELRSRAGFTEQEIERLEKGETVIRELERTVKREVAMIGAVKLGYSFELAKKGLDRTVDSQRRESAREYGEFSAAPRAEDMSGLVFDEGDLDDLRTCRVNDCKWNLSEEIIGTLKSEVDWNAADAPEKASAVLKRELASYLRAYIANGDGSLMVYRDTDLRVGLADEYSDLLSEIPFIDGFAGRFADHARSYPAASPDGVSSVFNWSEVKVGLKPVVMITHTLAYEPGSEAMYSVSKQVFANHYFDSTLGITALFGFPGNGERPASYLVFISRSRASALRGRLGGLIRGLIEDQAEGKMEEFLEDAKKYTALASANVGSAEQRELLREAENAPFIGSRTFIILVVASAAVLTALLFLLLRKRAS